VSRRVRARLIVAFLAAAAAALVVAGAVLQSRGGETRGPSAVERLREAVAALPRSGKARVRLGEALFAAGDRKAAAAAWREAERVDPDSPAALEAEGLLHPEMAPGRPPFVADVAVPSALVGKSMRVALPVLERQANAGGVRQWLLYGSFLQRAGRPLSARKAFDRALALAPENVEAETAADVARFEKDDPSLAFSRLGPLARAHPRASVVRYHLGVMLLWLRALREARRQLMLARAVHPRSFYGREAGRVLAKLQGI
jgi:tetratricopeptide (TPR) repeat protein